MKKAEFSTAPPSVRAELERLCTDNDSSELLQKFSDLLVQINGNPAGAGNSTKVAVAPDVRPDETEVAIATVDVPNVPEGPSVKIIDGKQLNGWITLSKDQKNHFYLSSAEACKVPRGTKLASVGSGKPQEKGAGIPLTFADRQDRTWVEILLNGNAPDGDADDCKTKKGTLYSATCLKKKKQNLVLILFLTGPQRRGVEIAVPQVCRDLFKGTSFASIKATGHVVKPNTDKNHGYAIEKQSDWAYVLKDKTESKLTHQNFAPWFQGLSFHSVTV